MKKIARLVGAAVVVAPIVFASPAQATTSANGCTVTPLQPAAAGRYPNNQVRVDYPVRVTCDRGRYIRVHQRQYEWDPGGSQFIAAGPDLVLDFTAAGGTRTGHVYGALPITDSGPTEQMYQQVQFRVAACGVTSGYTTWESGPILSIFH
jgi:hypothetical protein